MKTQEERLERFKRFDAWLTKSRTASVLGICIVVGTFVVSSLVTTGVLPGWWAIFVVGLVALGVIVLKPLFKWRRKVQEVEHARTMAKIGESNKQFEETNKVLRRQQKELDAKVDDRLNPLHYPYD